MHLQDSIPLVVVSVSLACVACQDSGTSKVVPYTDVEISIGEEVHSIPGTVGTIPTVDRVTPEAPGDCSEYWLLRLGDEGHSVRVFVHFEDVVGLGASASLDDGMYSADAVHVPALAYYYESESQWYSVNGGSAEIVVYNDEVIEIAMDSTEKCKIAAPDSYATSECEAHVDVGVTITPSGEWPISLQGMCYSSHDNENVGSGQWCLYHGTSSECENIADDF